MKVYSQSDFIDQKVSSDLNGAVGIEFVDSNLWYVWERDGIIQIFIDEEKHEKPLLDISAEVSSAGDLGLLGMALHPHFKTNGFVYLLYTVEPNYLRHEGSEPFIQVEADEWGATIGRLTRYQVDTKGFMKVLPESRAVLLGDSIHNGIPVLAPAHGPGGLDFGTDGTLLLGAGDGTTWVGHHSGGAEYKEFGYDSIGLADGIIDPDEDLGSYRAQYIDSYSGKILRIDPITGLGVPSNPFYDPSFPDAPRSKVWALGLRSPFRIRIKPGTGSTDHGDANPGHLYIGDVGGDQYEELNISDGPGQNFGWPIYEGMTLNRGYTIQRKQHPTATNPLASGSDCLETRYAFVDLLTDPVRDHQPQWINPCDSTFTIEGVTTYVHTRPVIAYGNSKNNPLATLLPTFDEAGQASTTLLPTSIGLRFDGISSVTGDFFQGSQWPIEFADNYIHGDFAGWIKAININDKGLHSVRHLTARYPVVFVRYNPFDHAVYYLVLDYRFWPHRFELRKITFGGNARPIAVIEVDTTFGTSPLPVRLSAEKSYDPQEEALTFSWDFGDGQTSTSVDTIYHFHAASPEPDSVLVRLTVTDESGQQDQDRVLISLNNTPPQVKIISPESALVFDKTGPTLVDLIGAVTDTEHGNDQLKFLWQVFLHHNEHVHLEYNDTIREPQIELFPLTSTELDTYFYRLVLIVTDAHGLQGVDQVEINPALTTMTDHRISRQFKIYPNPFKDHFYVEVPTDRGRLMEFRILDVLGREIKAKKTDSSSRLVRIDWKPFSQGVYFLQIYEAQQLVSTFPIFKN